jgi:hypothetical protein
MRTAIIINNVDNLPLLRFTQAKLFFDANNNAINFVSDCIIVNTLEQAIEQAASLQASVILYVGDFLTTNFRNKHEHSQGTIFTDSDIIKFSPDTYIGLKKRCHYPPGSKQLYIIENFLKVYLRSKNLVYLDNTEPVKIDKLTCTVEHLYGLASGWKTMSIADKIGFNNLKSITVYDNNQIQLKHAEWIHKNPLVNECPNYKNTCGNYDVTKIDKKMWLNWSKYPVKFKHINLFDLPIFPSNSLVWVSNVFCYEPNIFDLGWELCKNTLAQLKTFNKESVFI